MGTLYLVQNPDLPRRDALKVLSAELSLNREFRSWFIREADVAASLAHPNIVSIYDRGETEDGQLWIAMQFVDGTDADAALRAGTMTPARAVHIVGEVAKALDYAHHHKVVHRDIKPANFLLSSERGGPERVLLGDFGIARGLDDVGLTATGSFIATMAYAAPEVLAGLPSDGRADLYSLGCRLFRLLTGQAPFAGAAANGPAAVMMAHLHQPPPRLADRVPGLPPVLDSVIATALAKDPAGRFGSATEFASALAEVMRNEPPSGAVSRVVKAPVAHTRWPLASTLSATRCVRIRRDGPQRSGGEDRECRPGQNLPVRLGGFGRAQGVIFAAIALSRSTP
jgi:eukaryotic-like serine/threonine-protein kinase